MFELREYSNEEYMRDMRKRVEDKGLKGSVEEVLDNIVHETSGMPYIPSRNVQEWANDILTLIDISEGKNGRLDL